MPDLSDDQRRDLEADPLQRVGIQPVRGADVGVSGGGGKNDVRAHAAS